MNNVERFEKLMSFERVDRLPMIEWAYWWDKTLDRWYSEGAPENLDGAELREYLGLDSYQQLWISPRTETCPMPQSHGASIITNTDEYLKIKPHLYPDLAFDREMLKSWAAKQEKGDTVIWITFEGFFWHPRALLGIEPHMYAFYDSPELMHMINKNQTEFCLRVLDEICRICVPNFMTFAEDMSYNNGPMLSKDFFDTFLAPYYHQVIPVLKQRGIIPFVDSDGDITDLIDWLEEVGIEGILPLERMAGVDVAKIRRDHPRFKMIGAFDKTVMHKGQEAMRTEFERVLAVMKGGGFIASVDHQTPPDVSLETYCCYVSLLKEYCEKAANFLTV